MQAITEPPPAKEQEIDAAVCRAILYDVLAMSLRPPTRVMLSRLEADGASETVVGAAAALDGLDGSAPVAPAVKTFFAALRGATLDRLSESYRDLFGHTAHGEVPPYESEYGPDDVFRQAQELADIGGFYRAFGLEMSRIRRERNDHIAAECEFLSLLATKEAYEAVEGDIESHEAVRRAERLFLRDHAGRFGRAFARSLSRSAGHALYKAAGDLCFDFLTSECGRFGVPPGREVLKLRQAVESEPPMACGTCELANLPGASPDE
jgi:TorA maturation chaperone TorD